MRIMAVDVVMAAQIIPGLAMDGLCVMFVRVVMPAVMLAVTHRGLLVVVLVLIFAHLFVVALLLVILLRRCFLSQHQRGSLR